MLLHIAIGDAYGAGFEFAPRAKIVRHNDGRGYVPHELGTRAGRYTDDTQMSLAVAQALLQADEPDAPAFAQAFVAAWQRDPRAGYARGFEQLLREVADGAELRRRIRADSVRNGAAMRSVPLGVIDDPARLRRVAHAQASVTHDTPAGRLSSEVVGLMAHALIHRRLGVAELAGFVEAHAGFALRSDWSGEVEVDALQTLHAVHTALVRHGSMTALLMDCVEFGGDVDSVAAIALGLASLAPGIARDLPPSLLAGLEDEAFGRAHLVEVDAAMAARWPALALVDPPLPSAS